MKKILAFFIAALLSAGAVSGIDSKGSFEEPMPEFSQLGRRDLIEKMREIYQSAKIHIAQLETLNEIPKVALPVFPSERMLSSISKQDIVIFAEDFWKKDSVVYYQLDALDDLPVRMNDLKDSIKSLEKEILLKNKEVFETVNECTKEKMALSSELNGQCERYLREMAKIYEQNYKNSISILSVSPVGNWYIYNNEKIKNDLSLGVRFDFNAYPVLRFNKNIEIWGEYSSPRISTVHHIEYYNEKGELVQEENHEKKWSMDMYSVGISYAVRHAFSIAEDSDVGFKFGIGQIWGEGTVYNSELPKSTWSSNVLRVEANVLKYKWFFPVEIFAAYNWHMNADDLKLNTFHGPVIHNSPWLNTLQLGLRISFWWHPNVQ